jgi:phospholipid-binding lipoprotein MlaA
MDMWLKFRSRLALLAIATLSGCAHSPAYDPDDPLERVNRPIFTFNRKADQYVLRPVASTYRKYWPEEGRIGIHRFFGNLGYPVTIANDLLQAKFTQSGEDTLRFLMNSTIGLAGFIDVASTQGLMPHDEDLGQTFGYWGVGQGWYLMLPLLGPSSNRDLLGRIGDSVIEPLQYVAGVSSLDLLTLKAMQAVDMRARLIGSDRLMDQQIDPYVFLRTAYLQHRQDLVFDGKPPLDDDLIDEPGAAAESPP